TSFTAPLAPASRAIFGYSGSLRLIRRAVSICPPRGAAFSGAGAGAAIVEGTEVSPAGIEGTLDAWRARVGASGISVAVAGRRRWDSDSALNGRVTRGGPAGLASSSATASVAAGVVLSAA